MPVGIFLFDFVLVAPFYSAERIPQLTLSVRSFTFREKREGESRGACARAARASLEITLPCTFDALIQNPFVPLFRLPPYLVACEASSVGNEPLRAPKKSATHRQFIVSMVVVLFGKQTDSLLLFSSRSLRKEEVRLPPTLRLCARVN